MTVRDGGLHVPGFTDTILLALSSPFDLVVRWTKHVELRVLLEETPAFMIFTKENNGRVAVLDWRDFTPVQSTVKVPADLYEATRRHIEATREVRQALANYGFAMGPFFAGGRYVTIDDVFTHVADIVTTMRLLGDRESG